MHSAFSDLGEIDSPKMLSQTVMHKIKAERSAARRRIICQLSGLAACLVLCLGVWQFAQPKTPVSDPNLPSVARHIGPQPVALTRLDAYSLPAPATTVEPFAHLLNSVDTLDHFLSQLPQSDLSAVKDTYTADFFRANRLLAVVVQEPSSSISHRVTELTSDSVTILRDVPETGDCDMVLWLILAEVAGSGPEQALSVELLPN